MTLEHKIQHMSHMDHSLELLSLGVWNWKTESQIISPKIK